MSISPDPPIFLFSKSTPTTFDAVSQLISGGVVVLERLDYAVLDLVLGHLTHGFQFRFGRLSQPPEHLHGLPVLGGPVTVAGPPRLLHLHDSRQRGRRFVVRPPAHRLLLFAVDHHPRRPLGVRRLPRRQFRSRRRRVRRKTRPVTGFSLNDKRFVSGSDGTFF